MGNPNAEPATVAILNPNGPQTYKTALLWTVALGPLVLADYDEMKARYAGAIGAAVINECCDSYGEGVDTA